MLYMPQSAGASGAGVGAGTVRYPAGAEGARVLFFINRNRADVIPRLLGSPSG